MRTVEVIIPLKGLSTGKTNVKVEANGYQGTGCKAVTDAILRSLGGQQEETLKPEYYQQEAGVERISDGGASPS